MTIPAPHDCDTDEAARIRERLANLAAEREELETRLEEIDPKAPVKAGSGPSEMAVSDRSPPSDKIRLFRSLFCGRVDVYPKRWENVRTGKSVRAKSITRFSLTTPCRC